MAYYDYRPSGGRVLRSGGQEFQIGDMYYDKQQRDIGHQAIYGGAATVTAKFTVPGQSTFYLSIAVPAGREFFLFSRELELTEGSYAIDVVSADSFTPGSTTNTTNTPLYFGATSSVQTVLTYGATSPVNPVVTEYGILDTGTNIGIGRAGGAVGIQGVFKRFIGSSLLRIIKNDAGNATGVIKLIGWEREIA